MSLSQDGLQAALAQWTDQTFLECLTISHTSISDILLVNDKQDLVRTAGTFVAFPFRSRLHTRAEDRIPEAELVCDNVDQRIIQNLRGLAEGATLTYEVVLADSPNTVEQGPFDFEIKDFMASIHTVALRVGFAMDFLNERWPAHWFAPWNTG